MASLLGCLMPDQAVWVQAIEQDIAVVYLDKILYSRSASLHPSVGINTSEFNAWGNPVMD